MLLYGRDFLRFRHGQRRFPDGNGRSYAGLPVENFRNISRQTDAAMGNRMPPNFPYMQAQPRVGKTLPIRHGRAVKTTSLRYGIRGFGIVVDAFAFGIVHFAVEVGSMVFLFGDNGVVPPFWSDRLLRRRRGGSPWRPSRPPDTGPVVRPGRRRFFGIFSAGGSTRYRPYRRRTFSGSPCGLQNERMWKDETGFYIPERICPRHADPAGPHGPCRSGNRTPTP